MKQKSSQAPELSLVTTFELSLRAKRDLRKLDPPSRNRVVQALAAAIKQPPPENLDIKPLAGQTPWKRLRIGTYRVIFCQVEEDIYLIERIIHRRDLNKAISSL